MNAKPCKLCGNTKATEVRVSLARWRHPADGLFDAIPRCVNRTACRERCVAQGDDWPVLDPHETSLLPESLL